MMSSHALLSLLLNLSYPVHTAGEEGGGGHTVSFFGFLFFTVLLFYELKKRTRPASSHGHVKFLHDQSLKNRF